MDKIVLSEIALYHGTLDMPENFDIDRKKLASEILDAGAKKNKEAKDGFYYTAKDCPINFSRQLDMLNTYFVDYFKAYYNEHITLEESYGNVFQPQEQSYLRNHLHPMSMKDSPKYTMLYGVNIGPNSKSKIVIEFNDNYLKNQTCMLTLEENDYVLFPSTLRYMILPNQSFRTHIILTSIFTLV